jgi:hypothetical protein
MDTGMLQGRPFYIVLPGDMLKPFLRASRASLLTELYPHQTGIGHMTNPPGNTNHDLGTSGYRGFLNRQCVPAFKLLKVLFSVTHPEFAYIRTFCF